MTQSIATSRCLNTKTPANLILATTNQKKVTELRQLLGNTIEVIGMQGLPVIPAEETGSTFEENAILKAKAIADQTGTVALADDSGLEVDALGGAPGIYSARFAGPDQDEAANRNLLLQEMLSVDIHSRSCRFVCAIALAIPGKETITVRGTCEGTVGLQEIGTNGFGYDSLFTLPDGRTMAQLEPAEKSRISHRARAMQLMAPILDRVFGNEES
jgi:XTP/dITP diphosphohydrolase